MPAAEARREQAECDAAKSHEGHNHFERHAVDSELCETVKKGKLRKDEEIDVGDGDECDAARTRCWPLSFKHETASPAAGLRLE